MAHSSQQRKFLWSGMIMLLAVALLVSSLALYFLYRKSIEESRHRLDATVQTLARLITAFAQREGQGTDRRFSADLAQSAFAQAISDHQRNGGLGLTGEFVVARRDGTDVLFLLPPRGHAGDLPLRIPFSASPDGPMRRALRGERGSMTAIDYRGRSVLAAYQPVPELAVGLVVRVELAEIRSPFLMAGGIALASAILLALLGALVFRGHTQPLIRAVEERERRFRILFELSPFGVTFVDPVTLRPTEFNEAAHRQLGYSREEFAAMRMSQIVAGIDDEVLRRCSGNPHTCAFDLDTRVRCKSGIFRDMHVHGGVIRSNGRATLYWIHQDITERVRDRAEVEAHREELKDLVTALSNEIRTADARLQRELATTRSANTRLRLADTVLQISNQGVFVTDQEGTILSVNPAFTAITGYTADEAVGGNPRMLKSSHQDPAFYREMWKSLLKEGSWSGRLWNRRKDGEAYLQQLTITLFRDENTGEPLNFVAVLSDITELHEKERHLQHQTHHDALTDLPNRLLFQDRLEQGIARAKREEEMLAVLFIDIDRFKYINDTLGHKVGDNLLKAVGARISSHLLQGGSVSRFGGDEFVALTPAMRNMQAVEQTATRILDAFEGPFRFDGHELTVTASIGIAIYPTDGADAASLLKNAGTAMHWVKENGRKAFHFYAPEMNARALAHLSLESQLRHALSRGEFELHYQPQVALRDHSIIGMEALLRWRHPERGLISPDEFIPFAEETRLVVPIGEWVLDNACRQARAWHCDGHHLRLSINLSALQFTQGDLVKKIDAILSATGLSSTDLELELTESMVMQQPEHAIDILNDLKARGISIAVDDFGTGYSSLNYLKRFPIDTLKIDKSFIRDTLCDPNAAAITETIVTLGRALHMRVVAEGVETGEQLQFLEQIGCDAIQGFFFSPPLPPDGFLALLGSVQPDARPLTAGAKG